MLISFMRKSIAVVIFLLIASALNAQTIKIGAPQPMTGPDAPFGDKFKKAYTMAIDEINAKEIGRAHV